MCLLGCGISTGYGAALNTAKVGVNGAWKLEQGRQNTFILLPTFQDVSGNVCFSLFNVEKFLVKHPNFMQCITSILSCSGLFSWLLMLMSYRFPLVLETGKFLYHQTLPGQLHFTLRGIHYIYQVCVVSIDFSACSSFLQSCCSSWENNN